MGVHDIGNSRAEAAGRGGAAEVTDPPCPFARILHGNGWLEAGRIDPALAAQLERGGTLALVSAAGGQRPAAARPRLRDLGFVDLAADPPDRTLATGLEDPVAWVAGRLLPWRRLGQLTAYVTDRPAAAAAAFARTGAEPALAFLVRATPPEMDAALAEAFAPRLAARAARRVPGRQSVRTLGRARVLVGVAGFAAVAALAFGGEAALLAAFALVIAVHLATLVLRGSALAAAIWPPHRHRSAGEDTVRLADRRPLPVFSLMIPLYREAGMIGELITALAALDYPRDSLEVKLLVEKDDAETRAAIADLLLPTWISVLVVPPGGPRTKPRALNFALDFCRGDVIGIFDAEDRPDPQQLRHVAAHLAASPPETMAVQCQLSFYNARQNWLSSCFELEYAIWFEVLLRGYRRLGLPLPLGGTSVFLRASALRELGGWDAHNVTEDADLGIRLARAGGHCAILRTATREEAACRLLPWIRQRSRWTKGYILTWLSHMRAPRALWRELGPLGFLGFNVAFLGSALTYLAMPLFWLSLIYWASAGDGLWQRALPAALAAPVALSMAMGWGVMLAAAVIAMLRRRSPRLLVWAPCLPFYWWLGAIAAWKAVAEMLLAPFYWDKTEHGHSRAAAGQPEPARA